MSETYFYVNRWFDEDGTVHFFGICSEHPTIHEAQRKVKFNVIATPVDIVYQAIDEDDMAQYLRDVMQPVDSDNEDDLSPYGTL